MKIFFPLCLSVLAACSIEPRETTPESLDLTIPSSWSSPTDAEEPIRDWWLGFEEATLNGLIDEALANNRDLRAASSRVEAARVRARLAGADLLPDLALSGDFNRSRRNFIGFPSFGDESGDEVLHSTSSTYGVSLSTSWEIDLWGRIRAGELAAISEAQAVEGDLLAARQSLAAQVCKAWFAVIESKLQYTLAAETAASFGETAEMVRERYERGVRPPLDLRLALDQQYEAEALSVLRRDELQAAQRALELLLGRYPAAMVESATDLPTLPPAIPSGVPADVIARRPDLVAAERRWAVSEARVAEAKATLYPRVSLTASAGTQSEELEDLVDGDFFVWSLIGNLTQPLFEGGRLRGQVELEEFLSKESLEQYAQLMLRAFTEVETALGADRLLGDREEALARSVEQASAAETLARDRYRRGLDPFINVTEAQRRVLTSRAQWIAVRKRRLDVRVDLHLALGGGVELNAAFAKESTDSETSEP